MIVSLAFTNLAFSQVNISKNKPATTAFLSTWPCTLAKLPKNPIILIKYSSSSSESVCSCLSKLLNSANVPLMKNQFKLFKPVKERSLNSSNCDSFNKISGITETNRLMSESLISNCVDLLNCISEAIISMIAVIISMEMSMAWNLDLVSIFSFKDLLIWSTLALSMVWLSLDLSLATSMSWMVAMMLVKMLEMSALVSGVTWREIPWIKTLDSSLVLMFMKMNWVSCSSGKSDHCVWKLEMNSFEEEAKFVFEDGLDAAEKQVGLCQHSSENLIRRVGQTKRQTDQVLQEIKQDGNLALLELLLVSGVLCKRGHGLLQILLDDNPNVLSP
ncbi:hypothetical protein WICPIJ_005271 [Wickerhamomyces pijperi]|uniref:Uncharacterized protein n=1 Tax=Wickerhamomyces pijperi TaxID=599730 RepID=A0A9P8Q4D7_WICPI|nr:hypothetical protein WICPIJ_005271 [Wickerhamomyces pijperi]